MVIAAVVILALALLTIFLSTRSGTIFVQRSVTIAKPPKVVFAFVEDLRHWPLWSPQDRDDKTIVRTFGGAPRGVGATSDWEGKGSAGAGSMTVIGVTPDSEIVVAVRFKRPFRAHNINTFHFEPEGHDATHLTWSMRGTNVFVLKVLSLFVSADRLMGPHFEKGLANLKAVAERDHETVPAISQS